VRESLLLAGLHRVFKLVCDIVSNVKEELREVHLAEPAVSEVCRFSAAAPARNLGQLECSHFGPSGQPWTCLVRQGAVKALPGTAVP
jgi:hypothetical protein